MRNILLFSSLILLLSACGSTPKRNTPDTEALSAYEPRYARRYEVLDADSAKLLRVFDPWQGADSVVLEYRFAVPEGDGKVPAGAIRWPVERAVCMSSSYVAFLDAVERVGTVVGVSGLDFITNEAVHKAGVKDVGYDANLNYEMIVALRPDVLFMFGVTGANPAVERKLEQIGVPVVYIADYLEEDPLGRAEWVVPFGFMTGNMEAGVHLFLEIEERYKALGEMAAGQGADRPKVMLNAPYRDVWYLPGDRSYMVRLLQDAGAEYLGAGQDSDVSRPVSSELALTMLMRADYWLNPGMVRTLAELRADNRRFADLPVVSSGKVYNNNARLTPAGGSDFWESGAVRPDAVLADLVRILHPELLPDHDLYYFRKLE